LNAYFEAPQTNHAADNIGMLNVHKARAKDYSIAPMECHPCARFARAHQEAVV